MSLSLAAMIALAHQCAPGIAPEAIVSIAAVESKFDPLAINVNHVGRFRAGNAQEASAIASRWINAGYSVDLGIAQINSGNLGWTGLSVDSAFDPCLNFEAAERILTLNFARASRFYQGVEAISRTFSLYNSGSVSIGFANNYVARVWRAAERLVPQMHVAEAEQAVSPDARQVAVATIGAAARSPSFVVGAGGDAVLVFK